MLSLVEIGKEDFFINLSMCISQFRNYLSLEIGGVFHFHKLEFPWPSGSENMIFRIFLFIFASS